DREVRIQEVAVLVDLERALDGDAAAVDHDVLEAGRLLLLHHVKGGLAGSAGKFHPARQDVVELERGEIGFNTKTTVMIAAADLADQLHRQRTAYGGPKIEA